MSGRNGLLLGVMSAALSVGCSIGGTVSTQGTASGLDGVTVQLQGAAPGTTTTNAAGSYRFENLTGRRYTVTPTKPGYEMTPRSRTVSLNRPFQAVRGVDFIAMRLQPVVAPIVGNITANDIDNDGTFESLNTANLLEVRCSRVTYLNTYVTQRVVFEVDLSSVSRASPIRSALLSFSVAGWGDGGGGVPLDFHGYRGNGILDLSDATAGDSIVASTVIVSPTTTYQVDLRPFIQGLLDSGTQYAGLNIRSPNEAATSNVDDHVYIRGRLSTGTVRPPPQLTIDY
jgi:carboxypeptidase family protein